MNVDLAVGLVGRGRVNGLLGLVTTGVRTCHCDNLMAHRNHISRGMDWAGVVLCARNSTFHLHARGDNYTFTEQQRLRFTSKASEIKFWMLLCKIIDTI